MKANRKLEIKNYIEEIIEINIGEITGDGVVLANKYVIDNMSKIRSDEGLKKVIFGAIEASFGITLEIAQYLVSYKAMIDKKDFTSEELAYFLVDNIEELKHFNNSFLRIIHEETQKTMKLHLDMIERKIEKYRISIKKTRKGTKTYRRGKRNGK